jgi:hypothetical protein
MVIEKIEDHLPKYLSPEHQRELGEQLRDFENRNYYTRQLPDALLQGDGWNALSLFDFATGQRGQVKGIVLSNSCDISAGNKRDIPARIVFAPLVPLERYQKLLEASRALTQDQIEKKISAIRQQSVTSLFFLPKGGDLEADHIAVLDDLHNVPSEAFLGEAMRRRLFTLSQMGFYLFVLKLSIHFCRFQEDLDRDSGVAVA